MRPIDADALRESILEERKHIREEEYKIKRGFMLGGLRRALRCLEEAPTVEDVVQVVRCKDCEYGEDTGEDTGNDYLCHFNGSDWNGGEHFCSYGKRRGE